MYICFARMTPAPPAGKEERKDKNEKKNYISKSVNLVTLLKNNLKGTGFVNNTVYALASNKFDFSMFCYFVDLATAIELFVDRNKCRLNFLFKSRFV